MRTTSRNICAAAAAAALVVGAATSPVTAKPGHGHGPGQEQAVKQITKAVTLKKVVRHLQELQKVSDRNGGNRASGLPGYQKSVEYVTRELRKAGYHPQVQEFEFDYFEENSQLERVSPEPREFVNGTDFLRNTFDSGSPQGSASGPLTPVGLVLDPTIPTPNNSSGCEADDFTDAGFEAGDVALLQRGTCGFGVKALNAQAAGASAVVIMNEGQDGRTGLLNMIGDATGLTIPAVFTTYEAGSDLAATPGAEVFVEVAYVADTRTTWNVTAQTRRGNPNNVVMAGAHLDSVQDGAGINDNGTGSAGLLETAIQMKKIKPKNAVRFAWWGAEESGLLGSEHYVATLPDEELAKIRLYLNFDMIGSPNYFTGIYDGDNSGGTAPVGFIPPGSAEIEDQFQEFYSQRGKPFDDTEFSGRSDYGAFIAEGIPAGGLFTGAEVPKTEAQVAKYGGVAGAAYDPCYHSFCDNLRGDGQDEDLYDQLREDYRLIGNVNAEALDQNSDAAAATIVSFAYDTSAVKEAQEGARVPTARLSRNAMSDSYTR